MVQGRGIERPLVAERGDIDFDGGAGVDPLRASVAVTEGELRHVAQDEQVEFLARSEAERGEFVGEPRTDGVGPHALEVACTDICHPISDDGIVEDRIRSVSAVEGQHRRRRIEGPRAEGPITHTGIGRHER